MKKKADLLGIILMLVVLVVSCNMDSTISEQMTSDSSPSTPEVCQEILFTFSNVHTNVRGGTNLYAICPGDAAPRMVTFGENWNHHPRWSPDRSQIAFLSHQSGTGQVHIIDRDGSNECQLTSGSDLDIEGVNVLPDGSRYISELIWLPSGDQVAVALAGDEGLIWQVVDITTEEVTPLNDWVLPSSLYAMSMNVSHDGMRIAYTAHTNLEENDSPVEIYIQDLDGSLPYQLTSTGWLIENPVWSPDDSQIAFLSSSEYNTGQNAIYMINLDGSDLHEPILTGINPIRIAWSPDGKFLAAIAGEAYDTGDIFKPESVLYTLNSLNIRTGERIILFKTDHPNHISDLSW